MCESVEACLWSSYYLFNTLAYTYGGVKSLTYLNIVIVSQDSIANVLIWKLVYRLVYLIYGAAVRTVHSLRTYVLSRIR